MTHDHGPADSIDWDARYSASEQIWSGNPNGALVAEVAGMSPGTAIDIGCGEGADAIWLAEKGWQITALDVSEVALARAAEHIAKAGVSVQLLPGGLLDIDLMGATFDLVSVQYPALLHEDGRSLSTLLGLVAPGGMLLFVHHVFAEGATPTEWNPADYVFPTDVKAALDHSWTVELYVERDRHVETGAGAGHVSDLILKARRDS